MLSCEELLRPPKQGPYSIFCWQLFLPGFLTVSITFPRVMSPETEEAERKAPSIYTDLPTLLTNTGHPTSFMAVRVAPVTSWLGFVLKDSRVACLGWVAFFCGNFSHTPDAGAFPRLTQEVGRYGSSALRQTSIKEQERCVPKEQ